MFGIDFTFEAIVIEHPDSEDVLAVVPDRQHEPSVIDVVDCQISDTKNHEVRSEIQRVGHGKAIQKPVSDRPQYPPAENDESQSPGNTFKPKRHGNNANFREEELLGRLG